MARSLQHRRWIGEGNLRTAVAFVAVAILLIAITSQPAEGQTFATLHGFSGLPDGEMPTAGLTMNAAGNLYGTTQYGGTAGYGMVFKLVHRGSNWIEQPLYSFPNPHTSNDGAEPYAGVTIGPDGNLYGTTTQGGGSAEYGTVFKLSPPASVCRSTLCPWTETILYRFSGGSDGRDPYGAVVFDSAGNLYGTTASGGDSSCNYPFGFACGVVFKLTRSGSTWTETVLHAFLGQPDGAIPYSGLVFDQAGNLYGTTISGGSGSNCTETGCGTVFQLTPSGSGWTEAVIHSFNNTDGSEPYGGLIFDNAGNLYGTTPNSLPDGTSGTVFELTPSGSQWIYTLLYDLGLPFTSPGPVGTLAMDSTGNLYSTTLTGGNIYGSGLCQYGCGTVFKLSRSAGGWAYTLLYAFTGHSDGALPYDGVILDRNGNLYGTTSAGGAGGQGVVFEITP